jgi:hypothetical protein
MTHECVTIRESEHPVYALTTYELVGCRPHNGLHETSG